MSAIPNRGRRLARRQAAVNLVGIAPWGKQNLESVQAEGAAAVAKAAAAAGISNVVHLSAIGADARSASDYARTKAEGEAAMLAAIPSAKIVRPSVVFGPEDEFFNRFAGMARVAPFLPLIGGGATKWQPVYVGDVAEVVSRLLRGEGKAGVVYELGGPSVKSLREIMEFVLATVHRERMLVVMPFGIAETMGSITNPSTSCCSASCRRISYSPAIRSNCCATIMWCPQRPSQRAARWPASACRRNR